MSHTPVITTAPWAWWCFFSSRCMLKLKFAIYPRAASLSSQASLVNVCSIGWRTIESREWPHSVQISSQQWMTMTLPVSMHTIHISNKQIVTNTYVSLLSDFCACVQVKKMALQMKPYRSVTGLKHLVRFQTCGSFQLTHMWWPRCSIDRI